MKRILQLFLLSMLATTTFAQRRYHPENLTDYSLNTTSKQHRVGSRTNAPLACTGSPKVPLILVQFADQEFSCDTVLDKTIKHSYENVNAFYDKFCNGSSDPDEDYRYTIGSLGYVKQYFETVSDGQFSPQFVVIGPVLLPNDMAYYGKDSSDSYKDVNITKFYQQALAQVIERGVVMDQFDNNKDGKIDFVFFIYAGEGQNAYGGISECEEEGHPEKANLIWPKESASDFSVTVSIGMKDVTYKFGGYGCTNEMYFQSVDGIGTMCHELSHGLGLPDLYDTSYVSFGMDYYDVMDAGNYSLIGRSPVEYSTYERDFMGWRALKQVSLTEGQTITLNPIEAGGIGLKLVNPANANEYYIIENRQNIGFDYYFAYVAKQFMDQYGRINGLLITHVDYSASAWSSNTVNKNANHQRMTPLPSDGVLVSSIDGYTDAYYNSLRCDLYPGYNKVTSIAPEKFKLYTGTNLPTEVSNIVVNGDKSITIYLNGGDQTAIEDIVAQDDATADSSTLYDLSGRVVDNPSRGIYIRGGKKIFIK